MAKKKNPNDFYRLLEITDQSEMMLIQSILEREGIIHHLQNQELQSLFGMGTIGTGYQAAIGPVRLMVSGRDMERTKTILKDTGLWPESMPDQKENDTTASAISPVARSIILSLLWIFGLGSIFGIYFGLVARRQQLKGALIGILLGIAGLAGAILLLINQLETSSYGYY